MPLKPCLRCGALTKGSYCPAHQPSRHDPRRGGGARAAAYRRTVLAKTGGRCARCGSDQNVEAHHTRGLDVSDPAYGVPLCRGCHGEAHRPG